MTKREKIIRYLSENGIDILKFEIKDSRYAKSGTIVIDGWWNSTSIYHEVDKLTGWDAAAGAMRPIELKFPYKKDAWGNVDWFTRDHSYARVCWRGD